jgi:hypothetical protein
MFELKCHIRSLALSIALPVSLLAYAGFAQADPYHDGHHGGPSHYGGYHGGYYGGWHGPGPYYHPAIGVSINVLPASPRLVVYGGANYYYAGGAWYRPYGPRFMVIAPPIGIVIPFLPAYYDTRIVSGETYYVSDGTYYHATPTGDGYVVTDAPAGAPAATANPAPADKVFIYPRNGQSQQQQDKDRYECHSWAMEQSGFDPTQANGGVGADQAGAKSADYQRAQTACMDGRGYTVK